MNLHNGHKLISIKDEDLLKKENISIEYYTNEFNEMLNKGKNLKEKIEKEINTIDNIYDNINNKITKSYEIKHEKLIIEENNLKEKLQNEVTKIKEKMENFLSKINELIKINEKIKKGIQILEKENENEKNMIKSLTYISKINKNKKEIQNIFVILMKNLNISFQEEENSLKFEEYYFNGIQIPKDIQFKNISSNSLEIYWKIDDLKILNIDNKKINFKIECRNQNKKFEQVYEGNNKNCLIENLNKNTNYEIRICCIYDNLIGPWSEIKNVKTKIKSIDSIILKESKREKEFLTILLEWTEYKGMELIYRGTRDGTTSNTFHNKCDNQGPTLCLFKNEKGNIFGGYTSISWTNSPQLIYKSDPYSFIFTLTNIHNTEPTKFTNID